MNKIAIAIGFAFLLGYVIGDIMDDFGFTVLSTAHAEDQRSRSSIERIIEDCSVTGYVEVDDDEGYLYSSSISC